MYSLTLKKNTPAEIGTILGKSEDCIRDAIARHFPYLKDLDLYDSHKTDILKGIQKHIASHLLANARTANFRDLAFAFSMLEDKIALREGRTTQNIGIGLNIRLEDLVKQKKENPVREIPHEVLRVPIQELMGQPRRNKPEESPQSLLY